MSSSLYWMPVTPTRHKTLSHALKYIVARQWFDHDGSLAGDVRVLTADDVPFLLGVMAGSDNHDVRSDTQTLIDAIGRYGTIEVGTLS